ncbi:heteromeric transposase endonuclease subunit TnsA [Bacillus canaveralius]|uniref:Heteromeric transposase endonuclease subunit TnsA n=1 Tax=Bacillus canaveralius TaxID=1403243 RepID=A0A2N5GH64_9BACI|nr:TnsA endonuclease N-terminal domain-containing protein [Bacillus canaveralius]PLR80080.1 heteromeric transposase endonuclease subunit TnsA [Bacillus canaveralius]PLR88517.1 heteromeric transposase endonuclease subunit TnsA [Bacillus canaveralius]
MPKRQTGWTEAKISRYIKEGRGQGELALYKPWLTIQDVPSSGRVHRFIGWKTSREHHLLSDLEFNYLCFCDWADNVVDIREQFPLDREVTLQVADDLGIKHPTDFKTNTPIVMTTDFFLTVREGSSIVYNARTLKLEKDLNDDRVIEKFEIEKCYWERQGIDWAIVTDKELPQTLLSNLKFLRDAYFDDEGEKIDLLMKEWSGFKGALLENLQTFDEKYNFEMGTAISLYKHALAKKLLKVGMNKKIDLKENVGNILLMSYSDVNKRWA